MQNTVQLPFTFDKSDVDSFFIWKDYHDPHYDDEILAFLYYLVGSSEETHDLTNEELVELEKNLQIINDLTDAEISEYRHKILDILDAHYEQKYAHQEELHSVTLEDLTIFFIDEKRYIPGRSILDIGMVKDFWIWSGYDPEEVEEFHRDLILEDRAYFEDWLKKEFPNNEPEIEFEIYQLYDYFIGKQDYDPQTITLCYEDYGKFIRWLGYKDPGDDPINVELTLRCWEDIIRMSDNN